MFLKKLYERQKVIHAAIKSAFPHTVPILAGFLFLGMTYGLYMKVLGFSFLYPFFMALTIFGGSLEFVAASMLLLPFAPLQTFIMAFMIQARHLFYGISMLDVYKNSGWEKFFLIFGMCDESFSINYSAEIPSDVDKNWFMFFVTLFNYSYWILGASLGWLLGNLISFNTKGLDFAMTSMFVVIFLDQILKEKSHYSALAGVASSVLCLAVFGKDSFLIPSMLLILFLLTVLRGTVEKAENVYEKSDKSDKDLGKNLLKKTEAEK